MKTIVACVLGLAAFATSFASGSSLVYADALEMASSALPILAPGAEANDVKTVDQLHCVFYSDGADNCVVNVQLEAFDQQSTAVGETDMSATEPAPAVQFVDAIPVVVVQTVTIAAPGFNAQENKETAYTPALPAPAAAPTLSADARTTTGALLPLPPDGQSADAIAVAVVQSATVAARGQSARDSEAAPAESAPDPTASISVRRAKATAPDDEE